MDHLSGLNERQREAVECTEGPLLVLAGAGAGKTRVLTSRILHLIKKGVAPEKILAVTFTNKAAKEMRERVESLIKEDTELNLPISQHTLPFVSTFHALGVSILRANAQLIGLTRYFSIYDRGDSIRAIKESMKRMDIDPKQHEPRKILGTISKQKGKGVSFSDYAETAGNAYYPNIVRRVWEEYERILKNEKALDFDDLLFKTVKLLQNNKEVREHYSAMWQYMHVDEYQDTSAIQYELMTLLCNAHKNICVVGDIDQNIYSWRGANIENIFQFEEQFPGTKNVILEQNYRSTKVILQISNDIISKNVNRKEKILFTENDDGEEPTLYVAFDEHDESRFVADEAERLIESGVQPKEIAVLYRANFQSRVLEDMFLYKSIPYRVLGTKFFERKEVKDVVSFLRAALNPEALTDVKRVINVPPRGIGKITILKLFEGRKDELKGAVAEKIVKFYALLSSISESAHAQPVSKTIQFIIKESGLEELYKQGGTEDDVMRLENMYELVALAQRYDKHDLEESYIRFLDDVSLASDQDSMDEKVNAVSLMTVHAAKGLEFDHVFITGLEDGLFPHERMGDDGEADNEEERRLFYVALTRARKKLFLSYASSRTVYGNKQINTASEFITDIDESLLSVSDDGALGKTVYLE